MKKLFLFAIVTLAFVGCNTNNPEQKKYAGSIIGTLGCYDEDTRTTFYKGYIVETDEKDTVLSFNIDVRDSIDVRYGTYYVIPAVRIPYTFSILTLNMDDGRYVNYAIPIEDALHIGPSVSHPMKQVFIIQNR